MMNLPVCGWRIENILITWSLVQQIILGCISALAFTIVPLVNAQLEE